MTLIRIAQHLRHRYCVKLWICLLFISIPTLSASEAPETSETPERLSDQIESLKEEVLKLNRDLFILEEDLLFPASTQFNLYLSSDAQKYFDLDSVKITLNDKLVSAHLYTENQKSALLRGGIQKLHTGNIKSGEHQIVAIFVGKGPESRDYKRAVTHSFTKTTDPVHLEIQILDDPNKQQPTFRVTPWKE